MAGRIEKTYGRLFKYMLFVINPFKKVILDTHCRVHQFINIQALEILKNDGFVDAYGFFADYTAQLNQGVVWADQDFKSSGHFYNPGRNRGLYGNKDAMSLSVEYYSNALRYWKAGNIEHSMFYLGAAVHLVQDMTIPQHANIRLLDDHRQYENFIKRTCFFTPQFVAFRGGYYMDSIGEFIRCNARTAMKIYSRLKYISDDTRRFYIIAKFTLPLAQKTTAGCFIRFYRDTARRR